MYERQIISSSLLPLSNYSTDFYCYPPTKMLNFLSRQSSCNQSCLTDITQFPTITVPRYFSPCTCYLSHFCLRKRRNKKYFPPLFTCSSVERLNNTLNDRRIDGPFPVCAELFSTTWASKFNRLRRV